MADQSPYGDDKTVELFVRLVQSRPEAAITMWKNTMGLAVLTNAIDPRVFATMIERLEHGDFLDSVEATLQRMWQELSEPELDANDCIRDVLVCCGRYLLSQSIRNDIRAKEWQLFSRILGSEHIVNQAITLAKAPA